MPSMKADFLKIFDGVPTNFSFLTSSELLSMSRIVPVRVMRKPEKEDGARPRIPVPCGVIGP